MMNLSQKIEATLEKLGAYESAADAVEELELPILKRWISGTTRWSVVHSLVTEHEGALYEVIWHEPATEYQEIEQERWTVRQVRPVESVDYVEV